MLSNYSLGIAAGIGTCVVAYCIYFDHKRRRDPLFKQKLKEKRALAKKKEASKKTSGGSYPDMRDFEAVQAFFIQEVQLGEELLGQGDVDNAVDHLCNAVAICGNPQQLLSALRSTVPPQVFQMMLQRLPLVSQRIASSMDSMGPVGVSMAEDDVE